ncbi:glycosyltransferase [Sulfitobacter sp. R86518]|uniref:glycosyltransferase n=1 Tax=Sulfitobacter sp. R86518 TaxID=3093858 RepID=UPI0036DB73C0
MKKHRAEKFWNYAIRFTAPPPSGLTLATDMHPGGTIDVDVCIVTNCAFPGGNAATTITELQALKAAGLKVLIVHCSMRRSRWKWRWIAERFLPVQEYVASSTDIDSIKCKSLIVRGPRMTMSSAFQKLASKIKPEHAIFVVNNSAWNEDGRPIFSWPDLHRRVDSLPWRRKEVCPTGPIIRAESARDSEGTDAPDTLSTRDWPPVLDEDAFDFAPRTTMQEPIIIGRHARDHFGKWLEDPEDLLAVYPADDPVLRVSILGGADTVGKILGKIPNEWDVLPFGLAGVQDYLATLDVFVNFPSAERHEAFGRTIVEAILSGLPVILPPRFKATFGDLAFYCGPEEVRGVIERLASDDKGRLAHVTACRDLAASLYCAPSLVRRLREGTNVAQPSLESSQKAWRAGIMAQP